MSLRCTCPHCGSTGEIPDSALGKTVRCPRRYGMFPAARPGTPPPAPAPSAFEAFDPGESPPHRAASSHSSHRHRKPRKAVNPWIWAALVAGLGVGGVALALFLGPWRQSPPEPPHEPRPVARKVTTVPRSAPTANAPRPTPAGGKLIVTEPEPPEPEADPQGPPPPREKPLITLAKTPESGEEFTGFSGTEEKIRDLAFTPATLPRAVPRLVWNLDADAFYHLDPTGVVRLVSFPGFKVSRVIRLEQAAGHLAVGEAGVLVTLPQIEEVWLLDHNDLSLKHRVGLAGVLSVLSVPSLKQAIGFCKKGGPVVIEFSNEGGKVHEAQIERSALAPLSPNARGFSQPVLAPDGKSLFALGIKGQLIRYRVEDRALFVEDESPKVVASGRKPLCLSPDGKWLAAPTAQGNVQAPDQGTFLFAANDLAKPARSLPTGPNATALAFEPSGEKIYANSSKALLIAFDASGAKKSEYAPSSGSIPAVLQMLMHPAGGKLLLLTETGLVAVLPAEEKP